MKIILVEDVPNVGVLGDLVQVKPGYARNYLLPQGKAILASGKKSKELQHRMQFFKKLRQAAIENANGEAAKLLVLKLEIPKKAGPGGRLFGSVTNKEIMDLLQEQGFDVSRRNIVPHEPIKAIGIHKIGIKLHTEVKVDIDIKVIAEFENLPSDSQVAPPLAPEHGEASESEEADEASSSVETLS